MYFVIQYRGRPDGVAMRGAHHPSHVEFRKNLGHRILLSGPLLPDSGGDPVGSLIVVAAESVSAANELAGSDPLCIHGVNEIVSVQPFKPMVCNPPIDI